MVRRGHPIIVLFLVVALPIAVLAVVYVTLSRNQRTKTRVPGITFLQTSKPDISLASRFSGSSGQSSAARGQTSTSGTESFSFAPYGRDRLMLLEFPRCHLFHQDGTYDSVIRLERPNEEDARQAGIALKDATRIIESGHLDSVTATDSGKIFAAYDEPTQSSYGAYGVNSFTLQDPAVLIGWDATGKVMSLFDLTSPFVRYSYLGSPYVRRMYMLGSEGESVLVMTCVGPFFILENGSASQVRVLERIDDAEKVSWADLTQDHIIAGYPSRRSRIYKRDGSLDWTWFQNTASLVQPVDIRAPNYNADRFDEVSALLPDGSVMITSLKGVAVVDASGRTSGMFGDWSRSLALNDADLSGLLHCEETPDGFLLVPQWFVLTPKAVRVDRDFKVLGEVEYSVPPEIEAAQSSAMEAESTSLVPLPADYSLLSPGMTVDLLVEQRDLHPGPAGGYTVVDHTRRRVLTLDENLLVTSVLDRSQNLQNGLWQDIDHVRIDSRGMCYLLDEQKDLIQVLDQDGNYVRRHIELGTDLFGVSLAPRDIVVDSLDRLWIIGAQRIYVLDKNGDLLRIFETRGAPYHRVNRPPPAQPPEQTPLGYTILPSVLPIGGSSDPTTPIMLDVGQMGTFIPGRGLTEGMLFASELQNPEIVVFEWNGKDVASIDVSSILGGNPETKWRFDVGPEGYLYLLDPTASKVVVLDFLGGTVTQIMLEDIESEGWEVQSSALWAFGGHGQNGFWIDSQDRAVIFVPSRGELTVYPLTAAPPSS